jgi:hypothetical protein
MDTRLVLYGMLIAYAAGVGTLWFVQSRKRKDRWSSLHDLGARFLKEGEPVLALRHLSEALGHRKFHDTQGLIGTALDLSGRPDLAATTYGDARRLAYGFPAARYGPYRAYVGHYYWLESYAFASAGNWEFAYVRSREGLASIRHGDIPRWLESVDYESELRMVRMVSALHHLTGTEAFGVSAEDAEWILKNSADENHRQMARLLVDCGVQLVPAVEDAWKEYLGRN